MNNKTIYAIGDKVETYDGRIGTVIDTDKNPINQEPHSHQVIVVKFQDQSTTMGNAEKFKAVSERPFGNVNS